MAIDEPLSPPLDPPGPPGDADSRRLNEMGYAQELRRGLGTFSNFAISFSIISILAGAVTSFWLGMNAGGPRVILLGWPIVGFFSLCVGASMAEICSAYPTAGGLYFWSAKLAPKNGPRWSWFCGWFNLVGQIGVIASVDYALASFTAYTITLYRPGFRGTARTVFVIYLVMLVLHGLLNTFGVRMIKVLGDISVWWHLLGVAVIVGVLFIVPTHTEGLAIMTKGANLTGWHGPFASIYVALIGLLLAQYTITGFDASAHVSEETTDAATSAPKGIVRAIYVSVIAAFVMNVAMLQAIPKGMYDQIAGGGLTAGANLFTAAATGASGKLLVIISTMGQFFCGMACITAASRMLYAFSRDGAVPGHRLWHRINPKTRTPTNSVWLAVVLSGLVGMLTLLQTKTAIPVAFFALTGIAVIGLYLSYVIPVYLRLRSSNFVPGPWNLGRWSRPVGWISVVWVAFVAVLFCAPVFYPWRTLVNFNFTLPIMAVAFLAIGIFWAVSGKRWFKGPKVQGTPEELAAIEHELSQLA
ncbi:MAG: BAT1-like [Acidimicrobiales bacterium]|nr:BAT1-like [Acidimicrobiales bacterium]